MKIAREGVPFVTVGCAVFVALALLSWRAGGGWWLVPTGVWMAVALWVPWFFRDPKRTGPRNSRLVIAPADGKVVSVRDVEDVEFVEGPGKQVSVFMNIFDVHVNRHPVTGTVEYRKYRPGKFVNASLDKASIGNEQMCLGIATPSGRLLVRQIAGLVARRIVTDPAVGDPVQQGSRLGMIRFGSRVDTVLPLSSRIAVRVGDRTKAGVTVIAEWP